MAVRKKRAKKKASRKATGATQRARKVPAKKPKRERVAHIFKLMCTNGWVTGVTYRSLAKEWDIAPATLRSDSAEASRQIKAMTPDNELLAAQMRSGLQDLIEKAATSGEYRTAITGIGTLADITGVGAPKKLEVKNDIASVFAAASADEEPEVWEPPDPAETTGDDS